MSKANGRTVHNGVISYTEQDTISVYFHIYYLPSHLMNVGGKGEKLGYNPANAHLQKLHYISYWAKKTNKVK